MFYLLLQHRQTIKQGIDYIPKTFQNHVDMIWVSPNTGYPMSLWFISVSIKLVLSDKEATMIQDHLDVHSFFGWRCFVGYFQSQDCQDWHIVAYCCFIIWATIFEHVGILQLWNMYFFHSVGNVVTPTDELHHFSEG